MVDGNLCFCGMVNRISNTVLLIFSHAPDSTTCFVRRPFGQTLLFVLLLVILGHFRPFLVILSHSESLLVILSHFT